MVGRFVLFMIFWYSFLREFISRCQEGVMWVSTGSYLVEVDLPTPTIMVLFNWTSIFYACGLFSKLGHLIQRLRRHRPKEERRVDANASKVLDDVISVVLVRYSQKR